MLDATRLRTPCLFDKIVSADEAATLITDGMNVGVSGFTPSGYPIRKPHLLSLKPSRPAKNAVSIFGAVLPSDRKSKKHLPKAAVSADACLIMQPPTKHSAARSTPAA